MNSLVANQVLGHLQGEQGYYLGLSFHPDELQAIRLLIEKQWIENIIKNAPDACEKFREYGIEKYHELSALLKHHTAWPKIKRVLPQNAVDYIRSTSLLKALEEIYGKFAISDEENLGREEFYWRLVRPNQSSDVGPLHADAWFWELDHGITPPGVTRVKVWAAIYCEPGLNGLRVVPGSHKKNWTYHGEYRDGFSKPKIDVEEADLNIILAETKPGDAIIFNDRMLHGGAVNHGKNTRVSIEFTMFVKKMLLPPPG